MKTLNNTDRYKNNLYRVNSNKVFKVGEFVAVRYGNLVSACIKEIHPNNFYLVEVTYKKHIPYTSETILTVTNECYHFSEIKKISDNIFDFRCSKQLNYTATDIASVLFTINQMGCEMNPIYQRDFVWDEENQQRLLDSIFNGVDIGRVVLLKHDYTKDIVYEILDGKQRLTTLMMFYNDEIKYKGYYFHQLSTDLQYHFEEFSLPVAKINRNQFKSENEIYEYFIKLNTQGKQITDEHLDKVRQLIK